jgi:DNA helicase II / ATP-dependent DNA helicase PcrA
VPSLLDGLRGCAAEYTELFERAEVRDVLAWMRLLNDPRDAAAVARALSRPPIELRQVDLARAVKLARRRRLDLVSGLTVAIEMPRIPPQAHERIQRFLDLHRLAAADLDTVSPGRFVRDLIERLGLRRRQLFAVQADVVERQAALAGLCALAEDFARRSPRAGPRALAVHLAALAEAGSQALTGASPRMPAPRTPAPGTPDRGAQRAATSDAPDAQTQPAGGALSDEDEQERERLHGLLEALRAELLDGVVRIAGRLGELRLDTDLDVSHGVVRYLEMVKLAALLERPAGTVADALPDINARLLAAATPLQHEIYETSTLDDALLAAGRAGAIAARDEPSLDAFLPRSGDGLSLSASDIETYRGCPLRYKFARVLRIPSELTRHQRFGIVVHQALERYHTAGAQTLEQLLELLDAAWHRSGLGEGEQERRLRAKADAALTRYHERLGEEPAAPVWFERSFCLPLGPHQLRGRVDRVDRRPDGGFELIDYKTGHPRTALELRDDIQLSLYSIAAREDWGLADVSQAYYYLLDDQKVPVPRGARDAESVRDTVLEVGAGILAQDFQPTPSPAVCARCDYRIACPALER